MKRLIEEAAAGWCIVDSWKKVLEGPLSDNKTAGDIVKNKYKGKAFLKYGSRGPDNKFVAAAVPTPATAESLLLQLLKINQLNEGLEKSVDRVLDELPGPGKTYQKKYWWKNGQMWFSAKHAADYVLKFLKDHEFNVTLHSVKPDPFGKGDSDGVAYIKFDKLAVHEANEKQEFTSYADFKKAVKAAKLLIEPGFADAENGPSPHDLDEPVMVGKKREAEHYPGRNPDIWDYYGMYDPESETGVLFKTSNAFDQWMHKVSNESLEEAYTTKSSADTVRAKKELSRISGKIEAIYNDGGDVPESNPLRGKLKKAQQKVSMLIKQSKVSNKKKNLQEGMMKRALEKEAERIMNMMPDYEDLMKMNEKQLRAAIAKMPIKDEFEESVTDMIVDMIKSDIMDAYETKRT